MSGNMKTLMRTYYSAPSRNLPHHVYFIVEIGKQVADIFEEVFQESLSDKEQEWMTVTLIMLLNMKVIDLPEEAKTANPMLAKLIENGF